MDGGDICHGTQPQGECQRRTALQQSWKCSEDTVFPVFRSHRGQNILLRSHSNLKTSSQHISAFQSIQQRPEELLQTYNARYQSYHKLAHEGLTIRSNGSKVSCIHYANSLHGKLGDEMEGRFNRRLPRNLQGAFKRAVDFEPRILTKQHIHTRKVNEVNYIDVSSDYQEFEVNEAQHV